MTKTILVKRAFGRRDEPEKAWWEAVLRITNDNGDVHGIGRYAVGNPELALKTLREDVDCGDAIVIYEDIALKPLTVITVNGRDEWSTK